MRHILALSAMAAALLSVAHADSFSLSDFSAADFGRANAGRVTYADDAGVAFANPAMMAKFDRAVMTGQISFLFSDGEFTDEGSLDALGTSMGGDTDEVFTTAVVPSFYAVYPINEKLVAGFAVNTPFGLSTDYENDWTGRYQAITSELATININPSLAYALTETFSVGVGFNVQYADATLSNGIDFGAVCLSVMDATTCASLGLLPQLADGQAEVTGDDWSYGYNLGVAWTPHPDWRFGAHYRSAVEHEIEGDADFTVPTAATPLTALGGFADTGATADITLPASFEVGARWQVNERAALYATYQWMEWSEISDITVEFDNAAQPDLVETLSYDDAYRYGIGGDYDVNDQLTLRAGLAIDDVPTDDLLPSARIPDGKRTVYAVGASWQHSEQLSLNAAFSYIDFEEGEISKAGQFGETLSGQYDTNVPVLSLSASWSF